MLSRYRQSPDSAEGVVVNGRFRNQRITGVQRYAHEIVNRLPGTNEVLTPASARGSIGHLWEQTVLPVSCHGRLLWSPNASGPLKYRRQVVTFHDLFPVEHPEWYSAAYARWYRIMMRRLANTAMHLIAVSEYTKSRLVKVFNRNPEDITVIHNGCHISGPASEQKVNEAALLLNLPTRRYVLSLASMELRKNSAAILSAWAAICDQLPSDVWLVFAGPEADTTVYGKQQTYVRPPRVMYTGYVPDEHLAGLYTGSLLFVFPSFAEGFGLPLLEAMSCGVRCVASKTTSLPEIGGDVVDYINPADQCELATVMKVRLLEKRYSAAPVAHVIERARTFSWTRAASRTHRVLAAALIARPQDTILRKALDK